MKSFCAIFSSDTRYQYYIVVWHLNYQTSDCCQHVVIYISGGSELLLIRSIVLQLVRLASLLKTMCEKI